MPKNELYKAESKEIALDIRERIKTLQCFLIERTDGVNIVTHQNSKPFPLEHTFVNITYKKYKLDKNIYFVKEIINNNVVDYYFLANCNIDFFQHFIYVL